MTWAEQGARMAVRCTDCGGAAVRSLGQFLRGGRELWWDAERRCPSCGAASCEHAGPEAAPADVREALLTAHGPARLRLTEPLDDPVAALRVPRKGVPLTKARELLAELREFGLSGTAVEMAYWRVRLGERGVATEVEEGFGRAYRYVGPPELRELTSDGSPDGRRVRTAREFAAWAGERTAAEWAEPFTFVVDLAGALRLAPRRSEHVACAGGELVLGAGEIGFRCSDGGGRGARGARGAREVETVSNLSTGYCPDVRSWTAVAAALDRVGLPHPGGFTHAVVFRRCPECGRCGIVREEHYVCVFCDADLPGQCNVDEVPLP
ncbi:hypothetical protein ACH4E7_16155 [Kitasatospora sp. NPDC018058]|uniref:hypothetical protein n=1 Tax=Kitasatospora sp. NPDC018058 TaxID=3364025 RepID=UPI0037BFD09F